MVISVTQKKTVDGQLIYNKARIERMYDSLHTDEKLRLCQNGEDNYE